MSIDDLLELAGLAAESLDLVTRGSTGGVAGKPPLAGLQELLGPAVVKAFCNTFVAAQLGNRLLAAQAIEHDADLLFGGVAFARCPADAFDDLFPTGRWSGISVSSSLP